MLPLGLRRHPVLLIVAVAALVVTACSGDGGAAPADAPSTSSGGPTGSSAPATSVPGPTTLALAPVVVEPVPSEGCTGPSTAATGTIELDAADRDGIYLRHVPPAHDGTTPVPVVIDLHGYSSPAAGQELMSGLAAYGEDRGFVTILPEIARPVTRWDAAPGSSDVDYVAAVLDDVERTLCVDTRRIYAAGMSNGAFMASAVACDLADRVAAVAPVAGLRNIEDCDPARAVPVIGFHGTDDQFVAYDGGLGPAAAMLPNPDGSGTLGAGVALPSDDSDSVDEMAAGWAERNRCDPEPIEEAVTDDVARLRFTCPADADVVLYRVIGGGHSWPGSRFSLAIESIVGPTTMSISADELIWEFFQAHPMTG